ncbi:DUF2255 family protein [Agromyces sp. ISL-38]|uniref:DUF2255 family protein n=1 Tax=Agromyces sp. ISL-38 TaxID=2819107 RepID=UPI001BEB5777|nr:DUF2255 family protein [Agromyces sp. ISL-38]MBT2498558.1 DUF2255 family protein [Agromyces sp. ISL-38]
MPAWTVDDLARIGGTDELIFAPRWADGSLRPGVPVWVVRVGDDLFLRSYRGRSDGWFRHALERHESHISAGGVDRDVTLEEPDDAVQPQIDQAYRDKYARYGGSYVRPILAPTAVAATFRLLPADGD